MSSDAREALTFAGGLAGMLAIFVSHLGWQRPPEPLLVGACLTMMGVSLGAGLDRRARQRRDSSENPS
jgi:hypothetical protein